MTFPKDQVYTVLDFETYSEADLKKVGAFEYSVHPSTDILCAAWATGTRETLRSAEIKCWAPGFSGGNLDGLYQALLDPTIILVAHNAFFEQVITWNVFATKHMYSKERELRAIPHQRWICTASLAAALSLPRNLEGAATVLALPVQKDMEGRRLMLKWCKPKRPSKTNPSIRHTDEEELKRLTDYCKTDVKTETELFLRARPLVPLERKVWCLDQAINARGFYVDRPLVTKVLAMIETETTALQERTKDITMGVLNSTKQHAVFKRWLEAEGVFLPDLQKKTVDDALAEGLVEGDARELLEIRQAISKTSTAKYEAFEERSRYDGRLRDILVYHRASTGRWGGSGVQPQNFPRGNIKNTIQASGILAGGDLEMVRLIYGNPMEVFSSCIRNMIIAPPGKILDVADYAAIEVRVLFWVANHEDGLLALREGRDLYKELAMKIFGIAIEAVGFEQRWLGKTATLGCGYQMGWERFQGTCQSNGKEVSRELSELAVGAYREAHQSVVKLWKTMERVAISAVRDRGSFFTINHTTWYVRGDYLFCQLPSGRRLAYFKPEIRKERPTKWVGEEREVLYHWGEDSVTHQWVCTGTYGGRLVENVVQAIARDVMAEAMLRIEERPEWEIVLSVHDELVAERDVFAGGSNREFCDLMATVPSWGEGIPLAVEGFESERYKK